MVNQTQNKKESSQQQAHIANINAHFSIKTRLENWTLQENNINDIKIKYLIRIVGF